MELIYPNKKPRKEILENTPICNLSGEVTSKNLLFKGENFNVLVTVKTSNENSHR